MNFKKFISSVSAIAIAASAFAAMTVTASADTTYGPTNVISKTKADNAAWSGGVVTAGTKKTYGAARLDFSDLEGIADATTVTIEFDTKVYAGTGQTWYGVGDASARPATVNGSGGYSGNGLAMCFGSPDGTGYKVRDIKKGSYVNTVNGAVGASAHAKIIFDKDAGEYSYVIGPLSGTEKTDIANLTILDAYTNVPNGKFAFANVTVSYTVPDAPTPIVVDVTNQQAVTGSDGTATIVKTSYDGDGTIDKLTITATPVGGVEDTKIFTRDNDYEFDTVFSGAAVDFSVFVKGVESVSAIAIN